MTGTKHYCSLVLVSDQILQNPENVILQGKTWIKEIGSSCEIIRQSFRNTVIFNLYLFSTSRSFVITLPAFLENI